MMKNDVCSNSLVPNARGGANNGVGWEFYPEYHKRKIPRNV